MELSLGSTGLEFGLMENRFRSTTLELGLGILAMELGLGELGYGGRPYRHQPQGARLRRLALWTLASGSTVTKVGLMDIGLKTSATELSLGRSVVELGNQDIDLRW